MSSWSCRRYRVCGDLAGAFDLIVAGVATDLLRRIEHHAHAGGADRMAEPNQSAARVDRRLSAGRNRAVFNGLPRLAWAR